MATFAAGDHAGGVPVLRSGRADRVPHAGCRGAVPFEEDSQDPTIWFMDHSYMENMSRMFRKVNGARRFCTSGPATSTRMPWHRCAGSAPAMQQTTPACQPLPALRRTRAACRFACWSRCTAAPEARSACSAGDDRGVV